MSEQTEIEQALEIARKTRNEILFGKNTLEKNFHGFYTVAQILGRIDDMNWAKSELEGYLHSHPEYQTRIQRFFWYQNVQILDVSDERLAFATCGLSIAEFEQILDQKQKFGNNYSVTKIEFESLKKYSKKYPFALQKYFLDPNAFFAIGTNWIPVIMFLNIFPVAFVTIFNDKMIEKLIKK